MTKQRYCHAKNTKNELRELYILQNKKCKCCLKVFDLFQRFPITRMYFGIVGLFCKTNCKFEYRIWILCIFLCMGTYFKDIVRHLSTPQIEIVRPPKIELLPRSVNNFRIDDTLC